SPDRLRNLGGAAHGVRHRSGLIATVHHTIGAAWIMARAVLVPGGLLHQLLVGRGIAIGHKIAGFLPAQYTVVGITPGSTLVFTLTLQEIQKEGGVVEVPFLASKHLAKQLFGALTLEKVLLVRGFLIAVPWRHHHAIDTECRGIIKKRPQCLGILTLEDRRVGGDAESCSLGSLDGLDGDIKSALAAYQFIMAFLETIEVDAESEVRRWCKFAHIFLEEQRVCTEVDKFLARHQTSGNLVDLWMQ